MFSRVNQLARHLSRPLPNYAHRSAAAFPASASRLGNMGEKRLIQTAACLIIGDEVLGGKVRLHHVFAREILLDLGRRGADGQ